MSDSGSRARFAASLPLTRALGVLGICVAAGLGGCVVGPNFTPPASPAVGTYLPPESAPTPSDRGVARPAETGGEAQGIGSGDAQRIGSSDAQRIGSSDAQRIGSGDAQHIDIGRDIPGRWWEVFHNPRLEETLQEAIAASYGLAASRATLAEVRETVTEARAGYFPQIDVNAGAHRGASGSGGAANLFFVGPSVGYSIDAFGETRRRVEQQSALAERQGDELAAAYLALTGDSVTEAIAIAAARFEISTVEDLIGNDQKDLDLVRRSFAAGRVARTDVLTAEAELESDRTQLPPLHQQLAIARHALAVLLARAPGESPVPDFDIDDFTLPGELPVSLPSELVHRRPDILAAEAVLHADSAAIGVATAQMYPQITLSASIVQQALSIATLLQSASRIWSAGASAAAPVWHGGALTAQRRAAIDAYDADLALYRQTVLQAFGQVADSLTAIEHDGELVAASRRAVDIADASLKLQRSSYAAGKTSALQLIVAENTYSSARLGYVRALSQRLSDTAQLFIAAGGGWWNEESLTAASASR